MYIDENKLVIIKEAETVSFSSAKKVDKSLKHEVDHIVKRNKILAEHKMKSEIE